MTLARLIEVMDGVSPGECADGGAASADDPAAALVNASLRTVRQRLAFLRQVGLGYLHLDRDAATLSAGEAQRVKLAGLLGSGLTSLTVLLDEPTRGMHPSEVDALIGALEI
jgi:excinuclease ABC subunit A